MRDTVWVAIVVVVLLSPAAFSEPQTKTDEDLKLRQAHQELQRAVETIRQYHDSESTRDVYRFMDSAGDDTLYSSRDSFPMDLNRPRIGVVVDNTRAGDQGPAGAVVLAVSPGGPADEAGLEAGDVITHVDGIALGDGIGRPSDVLIRHLRQFDEGDAVTVEYLRDGTQSTATVELRRLEDEYLALPDVRRFIHEGDIYLKHLDTHSNWWFPHGWLDMELVALNPGLGEYFGSDEGVLVVRGPSSGELGLESGDVILAIDDRVVKSPPHAMRILRSYEPEETMEIEIIRHGHRETLTASVPEDRVRILEEFHRE